MVENVSKLTHENASLHSQLLDANKQMDREKLMRTEKDNIAAQNASKVSIHNIQSPWISLNMHDSTLLIFQRSFLDHLA